MVRRQLLFSAGALLAAVPSRPAEAQERAIASSAELQRALRDLRPGTTLVLAPGEFGSGVVLQGIHGAAGRPVTLRGRDPQRPPTFSGGRLGIGVSGCSHVTLSGLHVRGAAGNGINIDDGGRLDQPSRYITVEDVQVTEIGPRGNLDGLKMSGVADFTVRRCRFEGWGGSAIDMVGCHRGTVESCRFHGKAGFSQDNGVQMKGGSSGILVHLNTFVHAGQRAINLGGSTGLPYFRPRPGEYEATEITVAGNRFLGSLSPLAWVSAGGGRVFRNTFQFPERWITRILQEQQAPGFKPCQRGVFEENLVVFDRRVVMAVGVGPKTSPETFTFRRNAWFCTEGPMRLQFPSPEQQGVHQVDPRLEPAGDVTARMTSADARLQGTGADFYRPAR